MSCPHCWVTARLRARICVGRRPRWSSSRGPSRSSTRRSSGRWKTPGRRARLSCAAPGAGVEGLKHRAGTLQPERVDRPRAFEVSVRARHPCRGRWLGPHQPNAREHMLEVDKQRRRLPRQRRPATACARGPAGRPPGPTACARPSCRQAPRAASPRLWSCCAGIGPCSSPWPGESTQGVRLGATGGYAMLAHGRPDARPTKRTAATAAGDSLSQAVSSAATSSAIWAVFRAAPLRRLSPHTNRSSARGSSSDRRTRPTQVGSVPTTSTGVGNS